MGRIVRSPYCLAGFAAVLGAVLFPWGASAATVDVSIGSNGAFTPSSVTINTGDTVRWTNNSTSSEQVASDQHPTHYIYPDPSCQNDAANCWDHLLSLGEVWSFQFQISGTWGYHNHLLPGKTGTVTVNDQNSPPQVTNLSASATASDAVYLSWTSPGDDQGNFVRWGTPGSYDIRYSVSAIDESNWASATQASGEPSPKAAGGSESMTASGLQASTTYYFALKTNDNNVALTSILSNVPSAATLAAGAAPKPTPAEIPDSQSPNPPKNISVSTGDEFVTLSWENPLDADFAFTRIYRSETEGLKGENIANAIEGTTHTDRGLTNGKTYYYTVKAVDTPAGNESTNTAQVSATPLLPKPLSGIVAHITPEEGGEVVVVEKATQRTMLTIEIPPRAVDAEADIIVRALPQEETLPGFPLPQELTLVGGALYDIRVFVDNEPSVILSPFPMKMTVWYIDEDVLGIDEATVRAARHDPLNDTWFVVEDAEGDVQGNRITFLAFRFSRFALVAVSDVEAPDPPQAFAGIAREDGVIALSWENPLQDDFHHVRIFRSENELIATGITEEIFHDGSAQPWTAYPYTIFSVDRSGNISSEGVRIEVPAFIPQDLTSPVIGDGELVQQEDGVQVWVVKKAGDITVVRHILDARIPSFYEHLGDNFWEKVRPVRGLGEVRQSFWLRCSLCSFGYKVWEVNADGTRHHMDMSWEEFVARLGGDAAFATAAVFEVNEDEMAFYQVGPAVLP